MWQERKGVYASDVDGNVGKDAGDGVVGTQPSVRKKEEGMVYA